MSDSTPLPQICTELSAAYAARDVDPYLAAMNALSAAAPHCEPSDVDTALHSLAPILREAHLGRGGGLPAFAYDIAEHATGPGPLLPVLVDRAIEALTGAAAFTIAAAGLDMALPDPEDQSAAADTLAAFTAGGGDPALVEAWFAANDWTRPLLWLSVRGDVRAIFPKRDELIAVAETVEHIYAAAWLPDLLRVLDDEPMLVLHRPTGRAFRVTISGVGDNFQLHTLLAVHLIGAAGLPGDPPSAVEAAAATDGEVQPEEVIRGRFNLVDAFGERVWNEGIPADIPLLDGERVLVLDDPEYSMVWGTGRPFPSMVPTMVVEELLQAEAAVWWGSVAAAKG
ncbi:hypothetical protein ACFQ3B_06070 [Stackebrandtia endophytica]|uniref:hypothetical protein n=1 Tax=Stackebrandtia endophytica TaxID=1496996 RepID=UPI001152010E|nr:hypothetical protein [Stackebrandtia endophytica]